jgi:hypothetical protein
VSSAIFAGTDRSGASWANDPGAKRPQTLANKPHFAKSKRRTVTIESEELSEARPKGGQYQSCRGKNQKLRQPCSFIDYVAKARR